MIRRFPDRVMQGPRRSDPVVMVSSVAELECGCAAWHGFITTRGPAKPVLLFRACAPKHDRLIDIAQKAFVESKKTAAEPDALKLADELLMLAAGAV